MGKLGTRLSISSGYQRSCFAHKFIGTVAGTNGNGQAVNAVLDKHFPSSGRV